MGCLLPTVDIAVRVHHHDDLALHDEGVVDAVGAVHEGVALIVLDPVGRADFGKSRAPIKVLDDLWVLWLEFYEPENGTAFWRLQDKRAF